MVYQPRAEKDGKSTNASSLCGYASKLNIPEHRDFSVINVAETPLMTASCRLNLNFQNDETRISHDNEDDFAWSRIKLLPASTR